MKKILFPTEFAKHAPEVFRYAAELAYHFNARLYVFNAINQPEVKMLTEAELEKMAEQSSNQMLEFVNAYLPEPYSTIKIDYIARAGYTPSTILEFALDENIDLIVMGMTGKVNTLDRFIGNTTMEVLANSECPLLVVPASAKFSGIDNLVFLTNFEFRDLLGIEYLKRWAKVFDAPIHCLHIIESGESEMDALKNMSILKNTFKRQKRITYALEKGEFYKNADEFITDKNADVVVMMSHKKESYLKIDGKKADNRRDDPKY